MSEQHWLYRVMSEETAKEALKNNTDGVITLALKHPIAWNPSVDVRAEYLRFIENKPKCENKLPWSKPTKCGISDPMEGTIGPNSIMEPVLDGVENSGFTQLVKVRLDNFIDPRIRAICFSYFFGTEEALLAVISQARSSYESSYYLYGEVMAVLSAIRNLSALPEPSYLRLVPVLYVKADWSRKRVSYAFPWKNIFEGYKTFEALCSRRRLISIPKEASQSKHQAKYALDMATNALLKLADPYAIEKEVRLFVYSPEFNARADYNQRECLSQACKVQFGDSLTLSAF